MNGRCLKNSIRSAIAVILTFSIILGSPGLFAHRAMANIIAGATAGQGIAAGTGAVGAGLKTGNLSAPDTQGALGISLQMGSVIPNTRALTANTAASQSAVAAKPLSVDSIFRRNDRTALPLGMGVLPQAPSAASPLGGAKSQDVSPKGLRGMTAQLWKRYAPSATPKSSPEGGKLFDGTRARQGSVEKSLASGIGYSQARHDSGLRHHSHFSHESSHDHFIPAPLAAIVAKVKNKDSLWQKPYVKYGVPAAIIGTTALIFQTNLIPIAIVSGALLLSVLAHESAHILGLRIWGDPTPKAAGRDFINPLMHIDFLGTILIPTASLALSTSLFGFPLLFGWAKPVPVDFNNLKNVQQDAAKVAALGPLANLTIGALSFAAYMALPALGLAAAGTAGFVLLTLAKMNLALTVFNLLPLPWLDGGKLLVSLFPKNLYARWTANPNLPSRYQGIFKKIYDGPANILSRAHIHTMGQINGITRAATLAALGAFYAVFFTTMAIPFMFLALPCGYDYWCIAEKVRSEQAVEEMMDLMSEWGSVIVQIAEDHDVESEVSAKDVELNLVHAVDLLLEQLMTQEDFRNLSEEEKVKRFMSEFTEFAAKDLKNKAFTEDTVETIQKVLSDPRNQPFKKRLENWLTQHEIFKKMKSPEAKKKYKDASEEAKRDREKSAGGGKLSGFAPLLGLGAMAMPAFMAGPVEGIFAWIAAMGIGAVALMVGTISGASEDLPAGTSLARVQPDDSLMATELRVSFGRNLERSEANEVFRRYTEEGVTSILWIDETNLNITARDARQAAAVAAKLAADHRVARVGVARSVKSALLEAERTGRQTDIQIAATRSDEEVAETTAEPEPEPLLTDSQREKVSRGANSRKASAREREDLFWAYVTVDQSEWQAKQTLTKTGLKEGSDGVEGAFFDFVEQAYGNSNKRTYRILSNSLEEITERLVELAKDGNVSRITAHPQAAAALGFEGAETDPLAKTEADEGITGQNTLRIVFAEDADEREKKAFLDDHAVTRGHRYLMEENALLIHAHSAEDAAAIAAAAAADAKIAAVKINAEGKSALEALKASHPQAFEFGRETIAQDARKGVNEALALLVTFAEGSTPEMYAAFAQAYGLLQGEAGYNGNPQRVLFQTPAVEDPAHFMRMLGEAAAADPNSPVTLIQPLAGTDAASPVDVTARAAQIEEEGRQAGEAEVARRDAHTEWVTFLQNQKLADGSNFSPKQVEAISTFFKPVVPPAGEKTHPVIGRTQEMKRVIPVLTSPRGMINSVMLTGEAGTGKTAIFEGLAQLIEDAEHSDKVRVANGDGSSDFLDIRRLRGRWFVSLDIDRLLASEDPINTLLALLDLLPLLNDADPRQGNKVMLLFDEIQKLRMDPQGIKIMNALKAPIRDGKVSIAGTTTDKEWKEFFDPDEALTSRFERVKVAEPTVDETTEMVSGAKVYYEWMHDTDIDEEALENVAKLTDQFDKETKNPRKSVKLIHSASELARPDNIRSRLALDIREHWRKLTVAVDSAKRLLKKKAIASTIALPAEAYNKIAGLIEETVSLYRQQEAIADGKGKLTLEVLKRTLAETTGIDSGQLSTDQDDSARYVAMEAELQKTVINQDKALLALANAIRRNKAGLSTGGQPMGKFLFAGPTGVGKTYVAKQLAKFLFGSQSAYTRFDMSEFKESHAVARLIGSPPGYVGHGEGGQLTEAVRKKPYSVILFDEIEKAHPTIWDIFLQVLDDGQLTDGEGRTVDFSNTVIIFTSNIGMDIVDSRGYERRIKQQQELLTAIDARIAGKRTAPAVRTPEVNEELERLQALRKAAEREAADAQAALTRIVEELKITPLPMLGEKLARKKSLEKVLEGARENIAALTRSIESPAPHSVAAPAADAGKDELLVKRAEAEGIIEELGKAWDEEIATAIREGISGKMRPEVINRLDEDPTSKDHWITFNRLNRQNADAITKIEIDRFISLLKERHGTELEYDEDVLQFLAEYGFSAVYGARPLKQAIEKFVIDPLAQWILKESHEGGNDIRGGRIRARLKDGKLGFESLPRPEKIVERTALEGVVHGLTEQVMGLVESLVNEETGTNPGEREFDGMLRVLRQEAGEIDAAGERVPVAAPTLLPNAKVSLSAAAITTNAEHNNPGKKDRTMRTAVQKAGESAREAGFTGEAARLVEAQVGTSGEGWLKYFIRHAKKMSSQSNSGSKVRVVTDVTSKSIRIAVYSGHSMTEEEERRLQSHFTGAAVPDFRAAQQAAEQANRTKPDSRDQDLLDFYRRLSAILGAHMGYATGKKAGGGTVYWLEIPKTEDSKLAGRSVRRAPSNLTPHEVKERAKSKQLFLKIIESGLQDGPKVNVAAAESYGLLSSEEDLVLARSWILRERWADKGTKNTELFAKGPLLMTMANIMKKHGTAADVDTLESILTRYNGTGHYQVPSRSALTQALTALYLRAGVQRARQAFDEGDAKVKEAAQAALGRIGTLADAERVAGNPDAEIELHSRWNQGGLGRFVRENWPAVAEAGKDLAPDTYKALPTPQRIKLIKLIGRGTDNPEHDIAVLIQIINKKIESDRETEYHAAEAMAQILTRLNLQRGLPGSLEIFLEKHTMTGHDDKWPVLLAFLYMAQKTGGADILPSLEEILGKTANSMSSAYEQPFFETPITWAKVVVRNRLFSRMTEKIQKFLTSEDPMKVAAALYAIALERERLAGGDYDPDLDPRPEDPPPADLPDLYIPNSGNTASGYYPYGMVHTGRYVHYLDESGRFGAGPGRMPPMM